MNDEQWMRRVLRLAAKGEGRTSPNPMVGAILTRGETILGQGYHARAGEPHAEVLALRQAGKKAKEATLYINLEPCTHYGRTPPCAPQVIASQVKRVVIGMEDPNPRVKGRGIELLRKAGLEVRTGVLERQCRRLNEAFEKYIVTQEPFVILKAAMTLDGKIATQEGDSKWITGEASRRFVHRLRDRVDGVLVGIGTILKDDPLLTARVRGGRDPYRIVLDSRLKIPENGKVFGDSPSRVIIVTTSGGPGKKLERLRERGVHVIVADSKRGRADLNSCLKALGAMGIMSLLVEGGSRVSGSFLEERAIDKFYFFLAPKWVGGEKAPGVFGGCGIRELQEAVRLVDIRLRKIDQDFLLEGYVAKEEGLCSQGL